MITQSPGSPDRAELLARTDWLTRMSRRLIETTLESGDCIDIGGRHRQVPVRDLEAVRIRGILVELVLALDDPQRSVVMLRFWQGHRSEEIARALLLPEATVRGRLREALAELRAGLDQAWDGDREGWRDVLASLAVPPRPAWRARLRRVALPAGGAALGLGLLATGIALWRAHPRDAAGPRAAALETDTARPVAVEGWVVSAWGAPVADAEVSATVREGVGPAAPIRGFGRARSDQRGGFRIERLAPGRLTLLAQHPLHGLGEAGPLALQPRPAAVTVRFQPAAFVTGTVRAQDGTSAGGVLIEWQGSRPTGDTATARSTSDGRYRLGPLAPGQGLIRAELPSLQPETRALTLSAGEERTAIDLVLASKNAAPPITSRSQAQR
jgi:hypothetical protein